MDLFLYAFGAGLILWVIAKAVEKKPAPAKAAFIPVLPEEAEVFGMKCNVEYNTNGSIKAFVVQLPPAPVTDISDAKARVVRAGKVV